MHLTTERRHSARMNTSRNITTRWLRLDGRHKMRWIRSITPKNAMFVAGRADKCATINTHHHVRLSLHNLTHAA